MKYFYIVLIFFFGNIIFCQELFEFSTNNSEQVFVGKNLYYLAPHVSKCFENTINFHRKYWDYKPDGKTYILLNDFEDNGNGGYMGTPCNFVNVGVSPSDCIYDIVTASERMQWLMNHELTHQVITDKASSTDMFYRSLFFGKVNLNNTQPLTMLYSYLTTPRWYCPRWYHEGIAVFMETWLGGGLGRTLGGYDEMVFRTMVRDSAYFYNVIGLETEGSTIDFKVGANAYLYGTRFVSYLAYQYGIDKLKQFYSRSDSSKRFYASQFYNVYQKDIEDVWSEWIDFEKIFQKNNLEKIHKYPVTEQKKIIETPLGSITNTFYNSKERKIILAANYPGNLPHICSIGLDDSKIENLKIVNAPVLNNVTQFVYDEGTNTCFYSNKNNNWRGLCSLNLNNGKSEELIQWARCGEFAFNKNDRTVWAIQVNSGRTSIVQIPPPYNDIITIYTIPFGKTVFGLDISPDGSLLAATFADNNGKQKLVYLKIKDLLNGKTEFFDLYEFEDNSASNFRFSLDQKYLIGTSYYTGASNIFRIELATKKLEVLTNSETGYFRPVQLSSDTLLAYEYTAKGMLPVLIKIQPVNDIETFDYLGQKVFEKNPQLKDVNIRTVSNAIAAPSKVKEGDYSSFDNLYLANAFPIVEGYKLFPSYGISFNIIDNVFVSWFNFKLSYSPNPLLPQKERFHFDMDWNYWQLNLKASYNHSDFYDLLGPKRNSRAGYSVNLKYHNYFIHSSKPEEFDYTVSAGHYGGIDRMPDYQNIATSFDNFYIGWGNLHYSLLRKTLGSVEEEQGYEFNLTSLNYFVNGELIPKFTANCNIGILSPLMRNSSLWLRFFAGKSFGGNDNSFTNFYFGSFGNNYLSNKPAQLYREEESFPGKELNEIGGNNYAKFMLEMNFRPIRFRKFGFLSLFFTYSRLSIFGAGIVTNIDDNKTMRKCLSAGSQVDFELALFSLLKSTLSFGYAGAFENRLKPTGEFLISLKIM